jgi:flagellar hook-basal body complex protein FliE
MAIDGISSGMGAGRADIQKMIDQMRQMSGNAGVVENNQAAEKTNGTSGFNDILSQVKTSVNKVNDAQQTSATLKNQYLLGDKNVSMSQVVLASKESEISTQALLTVRNKLVDAYKEIMNMPV